MKKLNFILSLLALAGLFTFSACSDDDAPPPENEEEVIDQVILTFTASGATPLVFTATDPDGQGAQDFNIPVIELSANTTYTMEIGIFNTEEGENITEEVEEESDEHMFFFGWTSGLFSDPTGDGNIGAGNRNDPVNYDDEDNAGYPLGLQTTWTTGEVADGTFRLILKHQPDIKSAASTSEDGESDIDLTWDISIQ